MTLPKAYQSELIPMAKLAKIMMDRRSSFAARVEGQTRNVLLQREVRRRLHQGLREVEEHHINQNISPMGANDANLMRQRRELLMAHLLPLSK
jgi:hypothetical protein